MPNCRQKCLLEDTLNLLTPISSVESVVHQPQHPCKAMTALDISEICPECSDASWLCRKSALHVYTLLYIKFRVLSISYLAMRSRNQASTPVFLGIYFVLLLFCSLPRIGVIGSFYWSSLPVLARILLTIEVFIPMADAMVP
jgi:hypothetical protein